MTTIAAQASARRTERAAASTSAGPGVGQAWLTRPTPWSPVRGSGAPKAARNRVPGVLVLKRGLGPLLRRARAGGTSGGKGSVSVKNEKKTKEKDFLPEVCWISPVCRLRAGAFAGGANASDLAGQI